MNQPGPSAYLPPLAFFLARSKAWIALALVTGLLLTACSPRAKEETKASDRISQVENQLMPAVQLQDSARKQWNLMERMRHHHVPGVSIAVVHNYQTEWAKGYGMADSTDHRPVTELTLFQAASISKSLNAVGALRLVEEKQLSLDSNINQYLHSWQLPDTTFTASQKVTLAHLLTHTGGLSVHGFPGYERGDSLPTLNQVLNGQKPANTEAVRVTFEPGTKVQYSGGGVSIVQRAIEDVTAQPYALYMDEKVLQPLGMTLSTYQQPLPPEREKEAATGYRPDCKAIEGRYHTYPEQAAAGLWTTPTDLSKFIIATQRAYQGKGEGVLSPEMTRRMLTPLIDSSAAFGVFIEKRGNTRYFSHGGANEGFRCMYLGSLDGGEGAVVMVNSDNFDIIPEIMNAIASVYGWKDYYQPKQKPVKAVAASVLKKYTGQYAIPDGPVVTIARQGDYLTFAVGEGNPSKLYPKSPTQFFILENDAEFLFEPKPGRAIDHLIVLMGNDRIEAKRKK